MTKVHFFNKGTYFFKQSYIYTKGKFWGKSPAVASISKLTKRPHLLFDRHDWSYLSVIWKECCPVHPWESSIWALLHHRFSRKIHHQRIPFKSLLTYIPHICHFFYTGRIFENQILYNKMCIIISFLPISSHKMCEASAEHILWHWNR